MLHVLTHHGHGSQSTLGRHAVHAALLYLLAELFVEHLAGGCSILVAHTDAGAVLRTGLADHEDTDAIVGQTTEDAAVHTDDTHHGEAAHGDEGRALDAGDTLDAPAVGGYALLYDGTGCLGVEGILDEDGYVLHADGIDGGRIYHLGAEVAQLHGLDIGQLVDDVGCADDARVSCHETIHVRPYLQHIGIESRRNDAGRIVTATPAQVGNLTALHVTADESAHEADLRKRLPRLAHQSLGEFRGQHVASPLHLRTDEVQTVIPLSSLYQRGHDTAADALSVADDGGSRLGREVADEIDTLVYASKFLQQGPDHCHERLALPSGGYDGFYHLFVAFYDLVEGLLVL